MSDLAVRRNGQKSRAGRLTALVLAVVVALSAATSLLEVWGEADAASSLTPGTAEYYDARWEEAKEEAGNLEAGTAYTNYLGESATTTTEGPWMLEDLKTKYDNGEISAPWDGTAEEPASGLGTVDSPYLVYTAEELRYCIENRKSFNLMNDIDLGGYLGNIWTPVTGASSDPEWVVDGNGHVIYNYYYCRSSTAYVRVSLFGQAYNITLSNLKISNSYIDSRTISGNTGEANAAFFIYRVNSAVANSISNCAVENVMMYTYGNSGNRLVAFAGDVTGTIDNCYVRNAYIYNKSNGTGTDYAHVSGFVLPPTNVGSLTVTNSFVADSTLISFGGHSGGFVSCAHSPDALFENCFTADVDIYGNQVVGGFVGVMGNGSVTLKNCYSSGTLEGTEDLGGFIARANDVTGSAFLTMENCYTTVHIGLESDGDSLGGFGATTAYAGATYTFINCYAAGEVGNIDTNSDADRTADESGSVAGFIGSAASGTLNIDNCYYDKQTTAMREWAVGSESSAGWTDEEARSEGWDITGMLTTTTDKSGTGMTDPKFADMLNNGGDAYNSDLGEGYYPQLTVFSSPTTFTNTNWMTLEELHSLIQAYSQASVSTVQLNTYDTCYDGDTLSETTYDTVRDLTSQFTLTSDGNIEWTRVGVTGSATLFNGTGAKSYVDLDGSGTEYDVLQLYEDDSGGWYAADIMPGVDWVSVSCEVNGQVGSRNIRVCPTVGIEAGTSKTLGYNSIYDHADDVQLVYTTGSRYAQDVTDYTYGVYPDVPLEDSQADLLSRSAYENTEDLLTLFDEQDDRFDYIDVLHMQRTSESLTSSPSVVGSSHDHAGTLRLVVYILDEDGNRTGETADLTEMADLWNGKTAFTGDEDLYFELDYVWSMADGRYVTDTKRITYSPHEHSVTIEAQNTKGELISTKLYLDAYSISDGDGGVDSSATYDFWDWTTAAAELSDQLHSHPAAVSWKAGEDMDEDILSVSITFTSSDAQGETDTVTISGSSLPTEAGGTYSFNIEQTYTQYEYDNLGELYLREYKLTKTYTITLNADGVYTIQFASEYTDGSTGVYVDDVDADIKVVIVIDTDEDDEDNSALIKTVDEEYTELDGTFTYTLEYTSHWYTYYPDGVYIYDVLPYDEDSRGSDYSGSLAAESVKITLTEGTNAVLYYSTADPSALETALAFSSLNEDAETAKSEIESLLGTYFTEAQTFSQSGTYTFTNGQNVTALYFVVYDMDAADTVSIDITVSTDGNAAADLYANNASVWNSVYLHPQAGSLQSDTVETYVVGRSISGVVWQDSDSDGVRDDGEPLLEGVTVELYVYSEEDSEYVLCTEDVTGEAITAQTTGSDGAFAFENLAAGEYIVVISGDALEDYKGASIYQAAGADATLNNDGAALFDSEYPEDEQFTNLNVSGDNKYIVTASASSASYTLHTTAEIAALYGSGNPLAEIYTNQDLGLVRDWFTYELPEVGGTGTAPYITGGAALAALAVMGSIMLKRRKREKEVSGV